MVPLVRMAVWIWALVPSNMESQPETSSSELLWRLEHRNRSLTASPADGPQRRNVPTSGIKQETGTFLIFFYWKQFSPVWNSMRYFRSLRIQVFYVFTNSKTKACYFVCSENSNCGAHCWTGMEPSDMKRGTRWETPKVTLLQDRCINLFRNRGFQKWMVPADQDASSASTLNVAIKDHLEWSLIELISDGGIRWDFFILKFNTLTGWFLRYFHISAGQRLKDLGNFSAQLKMRWRLKISWYRMSTADLQTRGRKQTQVQKS